jgi:hypothetical protein
MKTFNLNLLIPLLVFIGVLLNLSSCQKQQQTQTNQSIVDEYSQKVTNHILDFKERMEYYKQNPGIKSGGLEYSANDAMTEMESLINFNFCSTNIECNNKEFVVSEVTMPLDEIQKISDSKLTNVYYNKVIDTIQAQMGRIDFANKKLLLVDLEVENYDVNGDAIISVGSLIGNEADVVLHNDSWIYGEQMGLCGSGAYAPEDGASQLDKRVTDAMLPDPPSNGRWYFTIPHATYILPTHDTLDGITDNYRDYKIFYASSQVGVIDDGTKCLSLADMSFYEDYYIDYAEDYEENNEYGQLFYYCNLSGNQYYNPFDHVQHDYTIYVGNRFVVYEQGVNEILGIQ